MTVVLLNDRYSQTRPDKTALFHDGPQIPRAAVPTTYLLPNSRLERSGHNFCQRLTHLGSLWTCYVYIPIILVPMF